MQELFNEVQKRLKKHFGKNLQIDFHDERNDGKHFYLEIISEKFEGLSRIERSREVYTLLDDLLKTDSIHALRMKCKTPHQK